MEQELAYSFHLGSDKNKSKVAKKTAKGNVSGTTSLSNNAIQNANDLSRVNKHNLRDYDNQRELITTIFGTNNIVDDVKQLYLDEFEEVRIEYNNKQTRNDRKIDNYYKKVCESQNDIACEIIIELGDMDFWQDKDEEYRFKMIDVYNEQIQDLNKILDNLKPTLMNKNNMVILNEDVQKIKNFTKDVKDTNKTVRSVNDLNLAIKDFEYSAYEVQKENRSLKNQIDLKDEEIKRLKNDLSAKEKMITKLREEKENLKAQLQKFKGFWHNLMSHFHKKITYDNDQNYKIVSDDLYQNGIFDDNDNEIANNIYRKVTIPDENKNNKLKKKNDFNLN